MWKSTKSQVSQENSIVKGKLFACKEEVEQSGEESQTIVPVSPFPTNIGCHCKKFMGEIKLSE